MRIKANFAGILLPALFIIGILISSALGYWKTEGSKNPAKYTTGIFEGQANPADIRGSYSFSDLEKAFDIPVETLAKAYGFSGSENPTEIKVKDFEEMYGIIGDLEIGTDSMRLFVSLYKGLPYKPETNTALPQPAWNILNKEGATDKDILSEYSSRVVSLEGFNSSGSNSEADSEQTEEDTTIKGKTTFSELLDWGLSKEQINGILGIDMGATGITVRDFCSDRGIEFSTVKEPLQDLLDNM